MIKVSSRGSFSKSEKFLVRMKQRVEFNGLDKYGPQGVEALSAATPVDSRATAEAWYYTIVKKRGYYAIHWHNSHIVEPGTIPVAILLQYGHGTRNGGFVQGTDYINPAMRDIFDRMAAEMWKEVTR